MKVPFLDLSRTNKQFLPKWQEDFAQIVDSSAFINGYWLKYFEESFAEFAGTKHCIGVSSGLDALTLMLKAKYKPHSVIAVPAMTFAATIEAVVHAEMRPVILDINEKGFLDLTKRGNAIIDAALPVYLYGKSFKYSDTPFIVDACQAHGAFKNQESCFSFYPGKNLGALGDAGAICTNDDFIYEKCKMLREHGQKRKYEHADVGYTNRMDNLQAMFLYHKLPHLKFWNQERIEIASYYYNEFKNIGLKTQCNDKDFDGSHVFHLFVILTEKRQELIKFLEEKQIGYGLHYPQSLDMINCYSYCKNGFKESDAYANAHYYANNGLSLPIFPGMTKEERVCVVEAIKEFFK